MCGVEGGWGVGEGSGNQRGDLALSERRFSLISTWASGRDGGRCGLLLICTVGHLAPDVLRLTCAAPVTASTSILYVYLSVRRAAAAPRDARPLCGCLHVCAGGVWLLTCVCACMCVLLACVCGRCVAAYMCVCLYVCGCLYVCVLVSCAGSSCMCVYMCVCTYSCMYLRMCVCMYVRMNAGLYVCMHACTYVGLNVCVSSCLHVRCVRASCAGLVIAAGAACRHDDVLRAAASCWSNTPQRPHRRARAGVAVVQQRVACSKEARCGS